MPLLHLTLKLPAVLTTLDADLSLPCTLIKLDNATLRHTSACLLANALEMKNDDEVVCLLLPTNDEELVSQVFCFGASEEEIKACATECGMVLEMLEPGSITNLNESQLCSLGERFISQHLKEQGWVRIFEDVFAKQSHLFPSPPTPSGGTDFVEAAKIIPLLDTRTTDPWNGKGQLGLTLSIEPLVYKRTHPEWILLKEVVKQTRQKHADEEEGAVDLLLPGGGGGGEDAYGGSVYSNEAFLELRMVKALPDLFATGFVMSLPTPTFTMTKLQQANQRRGWDKDVPVDEASLRRFWRLAYQIDLPEELEYVRVVFKGHFSSALYPTVCLSQCFAHNYSRTRQVYASLCDTLIALLESMPSVIRAYCTKTPSPPNNNIKMATTMHTTTTAGGGPGFLKTARQLRDEEALGLAGEEEEGRVTVKGWKTGSKEEEEEEEQEENKKMKEIKTRPAKTPPHPVKTHQHTLLPTPPLPPQQTKKKAAATTTTAQVPVKTPTSELGMALAQESAGDGGDDDDLFKDSPSLPLMPSPPVPPQPPQKKKKKALSKPAAAAAEAGAAATPIKKKKKKKNEQ